MDQLQSKQTKQNSLRNSQHHTGQSHGFSKPVVHPYLQAQGVIGNHGLLRRHSSDIIQAKLKVGQPNDKYELEADRMADQVMRMSEPGIQRKCKECMEEDEEGTLRRTQTNNQMPAVTPNIESGINSLKGSGQPLPEATRSFFEPRFGTDFSHVKVHNDARAADTAKSVNAHAFTIGRDVVFGVGQYTPGTAAGRSLLAHELTHVVQQGPAVDQIMHLSGPAIQLQSTGWSACSSTEIGSLNTELKEAVDWVNRAINDLSGKDWPARTKGALARYLTTDSKHVKNTILPKLQLILGELKQGSTNFQCQTTQHCRAKFPGGALAYSGNPITLCPAYFDDGQLDRISTLIHEAGHNAGLGGNVIEWQWPFPSLSESKRLQNTDSYTAFVRSNRYSFFPPYQSGIGFRFGFSSLFPDNPKSPRYMVTVEWDTLLSQRILRFLDLHLNLSVDVGSSGFIGSAAIGTRLFAPVSLSSVPLYLDFRTGGVLGTISDVGENFEKIEGEYIDIFGVSGGVGVGFLKGHFGGSVGYRRIWNFSKDNPDLNMFYVNGEIRFW
jgi:hypothetical protein